MKRVAYSLAVAASLVASSAFAADMALKAPPPAPPPTLWDVVVTTALMSDYNFRGITQSNHKPSTQGGVEVRYNWTPALQSYAGVSGESIDFPNNAAAEIDFYGGIRPTFDKLALDFGVWYYYYPGGNCYAPVASSCDSNFSGRFVPPTQLTLAPLSGFGNITKADDSFWEVYAKATYTFNDQWAVGVQEWYSPSVINTGAWGWYTTGNLTYTAPSTWLQNGLGMYVSADVGYWDLGTSDAFYGATQYTSYLNWDAGIGFTWKVLTLDLRYYDTNLSKSQCDAFASAENAAFATGNVTAQNPSGGGTDWCSAWFIAKLSASIDFNTNLK
ncbi:MAG: TorF family putative porin [Xanthobacteraceae bacterium]